MANRESRSPWKDFLVKLRPRDLHGVEFVADDDHAGLRSAAREVLAEAAFPPSTAYPANISFSRAPTCSNAQRRDQTPTHVVRFFTNAEACLRLIRALAVETHEN